MHPLLLRESSVYRVRTPQASKVLAASGPSAHRYDGMDIVYWAHRHQTSPSRFQRSSKQTHSPHLPKTLIQARAGGYTTRTSYAKLTRETRAHSRDPAIFCHQNGERGPFRPTSPIQLCFQAERKTFHVLYFFGRLQREKRVVVTGTEDNGAEKETLRADSSPRWIVMSPRPDLTSSACPPSP